MLIHSATSALGDGQKALQAPGSIRLPEDTYLRSMNRISMMSRKFLGSEAGAGEGTVVHLVLPGPALVTTMKPATLVSERLSSASARCWLSLGGAPYLGRVTGTSLS